jgi:hypothetical protein
MGNRCLHGDVAASARGMARARQSRMPSPAKMMAAPTSWSGVTTLASASIMGRSMQHHIFDEFDKGAIGITMLFFDHAFHCRKCGGIVSVKTCPHDVSQHIILSGT